MEKVRRVWMKKQYIAILIFIFSVILAGCTSPEETIYEIIEASAQEEKVFEDQQKPIADLVEEEKNLFDEIIALGLKEFEQISTLSNNALENIDKREEHINKEKESISSSYEEFNKIVDEMEKIKDADLKKQAEDLKSIMDERYQAYEELYTANINVLAEDRKIYELLKDENLKEEDLLAQIEARNETYEKVKEANEKFNEATDKFNEAKLQFYKDSGLNITSEV